MIIQYINTNIQWLFITLMEFIYYYTFFLYLGQSIYTIANAPIFTIQYLNIYTSLLYIVIPFKYFLLLFLILGKYLVPCTVVHE